MLSQLSQRPIIPMAFAASRAWKIKWDRFVIPMPGARIAIVVGEPVYGRERSGCRRTCRLQSEMESNLLGLYGQAKALLEGSGSKS